MRNDIIRDLLKLGTFTPRTVFDVGANVGQSMVEFGDKFPDAIIHSFEPIQSSFEQLEQCAARYPNGTAHQLALSSEFKTVQMKSHGTSTGNRILEEDDPERRVESITTERGDDVAARFGIDHIDFLKIDAEGHDLEVVKGFSQMTAARKITYIQVECGFAPENDRHVTFAEFVSYFMPLRYRLFGIYGQARRFGNDRWPFLMYGDAVFVAE